MANSSELFCCPYNNDVTSIICRQGDLFHKIANFSLTAGGGNSPAPTQCQSVFEDSPMSCEISFKSNIRCLIDLLSVVYFTAKKCEKHA